ncbi:hypothetical protein EMPS_04165 [Entomortierella parvispora]|uniref:Uncharacterized protein n=1 Tax=Entomortierella parvispora TaxID=205924 RepID=A0A9P3H865_9FUNG|nr:hypothetical protein EMPS_04165 [Entomortierella parvispora]
MLAMTSEFNVDHRLLTPYHPRGNGVAERHVKVAVDILKKEHHQKQDTWDLHVPMAQLAMNTRIVALHNSSPFSLFFARKANGFQNYSKSTKNVMTHKQLCDRLAYMTEIVFPAIDKKSEETQKKMIARFNATVLHNEFPDGAKVMTLDPIRGNKLTPRYEGPYTVVRRTTGGSYELRDGTGESLSRNYAPSQLKLVLEDLNTLPIFEIEDPSLILTDSVCHILFNKYKVGDKVLLRATNITIPADSIRPADKLRPQFLGPFTLLEQHSPVTFRVELPPFYKIHDVFHVDTFRPYLPSPESLGIRAPAPVDPTVIDGEEEYEVDEILKYRFYRRQHQFLVSFKGYGREADEWLPVSNLDNCMDLVTTFKEQHGIIF